MSLGENTDAGPSGGGQRRFSLSVEPLYSAPCLKVDLSEAAVYKRWEREATKGCTQASKERKSQRGRRQAARSCLGVCAGR